MEPHRLWPVRFFCGWLVFSIASRFVSDCRPTRAVKSTGRPRNALFLPRRRNPSFPRRRESRRRGASASSYLGETELDPVYLFRRVRGRALADSRLRVGCGGPALRELGRPTFAGPRPERAARLRPKDSPAARHLSRGGTPFGGDLGVGQKWNRTGFGRCGFLWVVGSSITYRFVSDCRRTRPRNRWADALGIICTQTPPSVIPAKAGIQTPRRSLTRILERLNSIRCICSGEDYAGPCRSRALQILWGTARSVVVAGCGAAG